jgi:hypothetical protein
VTAESVPYETGQLNDRVHRVAEYLNHYGDVTYADATTRGLRKVAWRLAAPRGVPQKDEQVVGIYRESYLPDRRGLLLVRYTYEYHDKVHDRRFAYHMHPLPGSAEPIVHAHCGPLSQREDPDEERPGSHLRAIEVDVVEANDEFMTCYATGLEPDCVGLLPLQVPR